MTTRKKKKIGTIFLSVVILSASVFSASKLIKSGASSAATVTDANGITYLAIYDRENDKVYAGVTDDSGNLFAVGIGNDGFVKLDESAYPVTGYDGTYPDNFTTSVDVNQTTAVAGETHNYVNAEVSKVATTVQGDDVNHKDNNKETTRVTLSNSDLKAEKYKQLMRSQNYHMIFSTNDPDIPGDVYCAFRSDGSFYMDTTITQDDLNLDCQVIYNAKDGTGYLSIPSWKMYCILPEDMLSDFKGTSFTMDDGSKYDTVEVYEVKLDSKPCTCEEYTYPDGTKKCYYFDVNDNLIRFDDVNIDGASDIYSISEISSTVDGTLFEKPKGYVKINLSWLETGGM